MSALLARCWFDGSGARIPHQCATNILVSGGRLLFIPTIARCGPCRVFFYSNNGVEPLHVHFQRERCLAKFWLMAVSTLFRWLGFRGCCTRRRLNDSDLNCWEMAKEFTGRM